MEPDPGQERSGKSFSIMPKPVNSNGFSILGSDETPVVNRRVSFKTKSVGFAEELEEHEQEESEEMENERAVQSNKGDALKNPLAILEAQAANTEIRGGQAGGYSSLEYAKVKNTSPAALHPVGEDVNSPFQSSHSVTSSNHSRITGIMAAKHAAPRSGTKTSDVQSPLHRSNHDSTVHAQMRPRALTQDGGINYSAFEAEFVSVPTNTRVRTVARKRYPLSTDLSDQFLAARKGDTIRLDNTFTGKLFFFIFDLVKLV